MAKTVKDLLAEANMSVQKLSPAEAAEKIRSGDVMVVDVRDPHEVQQSGKIKGAVNVSRGMLEFRADPESQFHDPAFQKDKTVLLHCGSGGRAALAGKTLQDMGYTAVFNIGGCRPPATAQWYSAFLYRETSSRHGASRLSSAGKYTSVTHRRVARIAEHARHSAALRLTSAGTHV